jgi:uncharacterized protein YggE
MWKFAIAVATALAICVQGAAAEDNTIVVMGEGRATARPDRATVTLGVRSERPAAAEALEANNARTRSVIDAVRDAGVPSEAIRTRTLSMYREEPRPESDAGPPVYVVTNEVDVETGVDGVGALIDSAVIAGANRVSGIAFDVRDRQALARKARARAVADARDKAEQLASEARVSLGAVRQIVEGGRPRPQPMMRAAMVSSAPVEPGTAEVSATVTITFALEP